MCYTIGMSKTTIALMLLLSSTFPLSSHNWYDGDCCGGNDCHPVPCEEITEKKDGYHWKNLVFKFKESIRPSKDNQCHVCHTDTNPHCLYILQTT